MAERVAVALINGKVAPMPEGDSLVTAYGKSATQTEYIVQASEDLTAGDFVNLFDDGGTIKARKASATTSGKEAVGFVLKSAVLGTIVPIQMAGVNDQLTGLSTGDRYYLSALGGETTSTPPSTSGNVVQYVGNAISASRIVFVPGDTVLLP